MRPSTVNLWRAQKDAATTKRNVQRFCFGKQKELVVWCQNNVSILIVEVTRRIVVDNAFLFHVSTEVWYSQRLADALQKFLVRTVLLLREKKRDTVSHSPQRAIKGRQRV